MITGFTYRLSGLRLAPSKQIRTINRETANICRDIAQLVEHQHMTLAVAGSSLAPVNFTLFNPKLYTAPGWLKIHKLFNFRKKVMSIGTKLKLVDLRNNTRINKIV